MEKRKMDINYDNNDINNDDNNSKYTFVLPGDKYKDVTISFDENLKAKDIGKKKKNHN